MPTLSKYKNILIAVVSFCVLYLAYVYLSPFLGVESEVALVQSATNPMSAKHLEIVKRLNQAKDITFDVEFFNSQEYTGLIDHTIEIDKNSEPVKRVNPFAPIGR